jgi:hypothetical protein
MLASKLKSAYDYEYPRFLREMRDCDIKQMLCSGRWATKQQADTEPERGLPALTPNRTVQYNQELLVI